MNFIISCSLLSRYAPFSWLLTFVPRANTITTDAESLVNADIVGNVSKDF